jgi:hypothetical protein
MCSRAQQPPPLLLPLHPVTLLVFAPGDAAGDLVSACAAHIARVMLHISHDASAVAKVGMPSTMLSLQASSCASADRRAWRMVSRSLVMPHPATCQEGRNATADGRTDELLSKQSAESERTAMCVWDVRSMPSWTSVTTMPSWTSVTTMPHDNESRVTIMIPDLLGEPVLTCTLEIGARRTPAPDDGAV